MTDDSNIFLRWIINNARDVFVAGKAESEEFNEGGFKWMATIERRPESPFDKINFGLRCGVDHDDPWKCEAEVSVHVYNRNGLFGTWFEKNQVSFDENNSSWLKKIFRFWSFFNDSVYNINNTITMEFRIRIINSERGLAITDLPTFSVPTRMCNVIIKIGEEKLHVSKEYLSVHSPVFEAMFFGDFVEKGKEEIEIKDIVFEEFLDLLHVTYVDTMEITDRTLPHILKLADRFQMERVMNQAKKHLMRTKGFDVMKKLLFADQYNLVSLRDLCLQKFTSAAELSTGLPSTPEYASFSAGMKTAICDRIVALSEVMTDDSKIVLRLEIDNAAATLAKGKAESGVFNEGGFRWTAAVERGYQSPDNDEYRTNFILKCAVDHNGPWKTEGTLNVFVLTSDGSAYDEWLKNSSFSLNSNNSLSLHPSEACFHVLIEDSFFNINDKVTLEFRIQLTHSERDYSVYQTKFASPNDVFNVILIIGDNKLKVSKEYLAIHSPVFSAMFFGDFSEKEKEEVELKDIIYEEFVDLLKFIFIVNMDITERSVSHVLKLADRFQMERVIDQVKKYLSESNKIDTMKKLLIADQYKFTAIKEECLQSFYSVLGLARKLKRSPDYANFSGELKIEICDRIVELTPVN